MPAASLVPAAWRAALLNAFRAAVRTSWAPALFAVPSFAALLAMQDALIDTPTSFVPIPRILIAYAIPFAFGWLLYHSVELLDVLRRRAWIHTVWAFAASGAFLALAALYFAGYLGHPAGWSWQFLVGRGLASIAQWSLTFAITGLFLRYLDRSSALQRYLCDSSYFLYLAHMPVVIALQLMLAPVPIPPLAKVPLVLVAATAVLLVLYRYAVRPTVVGAALNGRRYPRHLAPAPA